MEERGEKFSRKNLKKSSEKKILNGGKKKMEDNLPSLNLWGRNLLNGEIHRSK